VRVVIKPFDEDEITKPVSADQIKSWPVTVTFSVDVLHAPKAIEIMERQTQEKREQMEREARPERIRGSQQSILREIQELIKDYPEFSLPERQNFLKQITS